MAAGLSLRFWDTGRLLVQRPGRWEVRSWPDWRLLEVGVGIAVAEPGGDRLAVAAPDGTIGVAGAAARTLPSAAGTPTDLVWSGDSLVVAARAAGGPGRPDPAERSSLWRLPVDGTPATWLYDARRAAASGRCTRWVVRCSSTTIPTVIGRRRPRG
jgi:hypothetical protein